MKRRDFINLSASVALLSCSKKSSPIEPVLAESDLRSALLRPPQTTVRGNMLNDGVDHVGGVIVITSNGIDIVQHCGTVFVGIPV